MKKTLFIFGSMLSLIGCMNQTVLQQEPLEPSVKAHAIGLQEIASVRPDSDHPKVMVNISEGDSILQLHSLLPMLVINDEVLKYKLTKQYSNWQGAPYRMGGLTKKGIDCSGFVFLTFFEQFNINLPRSTSSQLKVGQPVAKEHLQIGDLVFFKNKKNQKHVGIYYGDSNFIHASTREGVKISSLLNSYWSSTYWLARRL